MGMSGQLVVRDARIFHHLLSHHRAEVRGKARHNQQLKVEPGVHSTEAERIAHQRRCELRRRLAGLHRDGLENFVGLGDNFIGAVDIEERVDDLQVGRPAQEFLLVDINLDVRWDDPLCE